VTLHGNIFAPDAPTSHFKGFLVGALSDWVAGKPAAKRDAAARAAQRHSLLDVSGQALSNCELKIVREPTGKAGPEKPDKDSPPFPVTVCGVLSGSMRITLHDRESDDKRDTVLRTGDFLAWRGSTCKHTWICESEAVVVTLRWDEVGVMHNDRKP
jgi:hypothetical protein